MENVSDLNEIMEGLKNSKKYLTDIFSSRGLEVGILYLFEGQEDSQTTHKTDEVYIVVEGNGYIEINERKRRISKGNLIFVPSNARHRFIRHQQDLIVLYFLGG
jgi:mannose-6-phosphate isomerase-like protein (cupin superfamily)